MEYIIRDNLCNFMSIHVYKVEKNMNAQSKYETSGNISQQSLFLCHLSIYCLSSKFTLWFMYALVTGGFPLKNFSIEGSTVLNSLNRGRCRDIAARRGSAVPGCCGLSVCEDRLLKMPQPLRRTSSLSNLSALAW